MKQGITLLELMLVVGIVSFISISTITGFSVSSQRLKFQNQLSSLESFITTQRAAGFNDTTGDKNYSVLISQNQIQAITTETISGNQVNGSPRNFQVPTEDLIIEKFNARPTNSNGPWPEIPIDQTIQIQINPQQRTCDITANSTNYLALHIAIRKPFEADPSKHLYIQRTNCLIESLNDQIQN